MKYESDILKRLIDTYGVVGNPQYISEIIKEFIVQGKECFPNLFTYQSDWLAHIDEFGLNPSYTVSYTGQSIYAPNTLEKPVKSAILKGNTGYRDIDTGEILETFEEGRNLELVSVKMPVLTTYGVNVFFEDNTMEYGAWASNGMAVSSTSEIRCKNKHTPFPKGLKNGDKMYIVLSDTSINSNTNMHVYDENKTYLSPSNRGCTVSNFVNGVAVVSINDIAKCSYFSFRVVSSNINCGFALMINDCVPYEPFKSNILTVNEDVTLCSNGDICDELNLLTGQLTQRIGEDGGILTQEVVKTVDLSILDQNGRNVKQLMAFNGGTHFNTGSSVGSPLPTVSVSVETDLEETLKVCSLEGNTL